MQKQAWTWTTQRLPEPARMARWGHFGTPVVIFPTAGGDFEEIERFELMLQAGMGDSYLKGHPWFEYDWFQEIVRDQLSKMKRGGIRLKTYSPPQGAPEQASRPIEPSPATPPIAEAAGG